MSPRPDAKYRRVADDLRRRITDGDLPPGTLLPTEKEIGAEYGVARGTVRESLDVLRDEGLIDTRNRRGSVVRAPMPVRRIAMDRYRADAAQITGNQPPETSFTRDQGIEWRHYTLDKRFQIIEADERLATLLHIDPGAPVLERRFVFRNRGAPQQMSRSCYPLHLVDGTPITDPDNEPWPGGNIAQLASIGITVTAVEETVAARRATDEEAETLRLPGAAVVLVVTRRMLAGDQPVEAAADIVIPADRVVLDYRIDL